MLKYPSLENHYNITSSRKLMAALDKEFYATEKIHGSNMSIEFTKDLLLLAEEGLEMRNKQEMTYLQPLKEELNL